MRPPGGARVLGRWLLTLAGHRRRGGRHRRYPPVSGGLVLVVTFGLLAAGAWVVGRHATQPDVAPRVGVRLGESVPGYVAGARSKLSRLAGSAHPDRPLVALISLTAYLAPSRVAVVLSGLRTERVYTRVPLPGIGSHVTTLPVRRVPVDVNTGMDQLALDRQRMATNLDHLATASTVSENQRREYGVEGQTYRIEAAAYRGRCSCVFAAVVRAAPELLLRVARRPAVRAVEPAPQVDSLTDAVFTPPLPEQTGAAAPPEDPPVSPSSTPRRPSAPPATGAPSTTPTQPPVGVSPPPPTGVPSTPSPGLSEPGSPGVEVPGTSGPPTESVTLPAAADGHGTVAARPRSRPSPLPAERNLPDWVRRWW
ncbi:MAG: hypothetical protein WCA46_23300 [Actinocatenispora sp.]